MAKTFPDCEILVDGNDGFTADSMIAYVKGIGDIPCINDDIDFGDYKIVGGQLVPSSAPGYGMKLLKTI